jgi:hypothetical protein
VISIFPLSLFSSLLTIREIPTDMINDFSFMILTHESTKKDENENGKNSQSEAREKFANDVAK